MAHDNTAKVYYAEPHVQFKKLVWPNPKHKGITYLAGYQQYMHEWRLLMRIIPAREVPNPKRLAGIMMRAIRPFDLKERVRSRNIAGKEPYPRNRRVAE